MERKVVLITGGAMGQGKAHALKFAQNGFDVVLIHFMKTRLIINILSFLVYHTIKPYLCHRQIIFITNVIRYYHYYDKVTSLL